MDLSLELLLLLFFVAACAGLLDTLAGGGGLITIPALVLAGVPPLAALGTNKLQGCVGTATSSFLLFKRKKIHWVEVRGSMFTAFSGAIVGTILIQFVDTAVLRFMIPCVLVTIAAYFIASPYLKFNATRARMSEPVYKKTVLQVRERASLACRMHPFLLHLQSFSHIQVAP